MIIESAAQMEKLLDVLATEMKMYRMQGDTAKALKAFKAMKNITGGCKLRLLGVMLRLSKSSAKGGIETMEKKAGEIVKGVLEREAYTERAGVLARALGKGAVRFGGHFLGAAGAILIVKDLVDVGNWMADSMGEKMTLGRIAKYDDYLDENQTDSMGYNEWLAQVYFPAQQEKTSGFFKQLKTLFPHSIPV